MFTEQSDRERVPSTIHACDRRLYVEALDINAQLMQLNIETRDCARRSRYHNVRHLAIPVEATVADCPRRPASRRVPPVAAPGSPPAEFLIFRRRRIAHLPDP